MVYTIFCGHGIEAVPLPSKQENASSSLAARSKLLTDSLIGKALDSESRKSRFES